jgi:para-nitrobenzyl esterase
MRAIWILCAVLPLGAADTAGVPVRVTGGIVLGAPLEQGGVAFKGIPFAQPPVGDLRWQPPVAVKPWTGVRAATAFGAPCAQNSGGQMLAGSSEDCLYLNVWVPEWAPKSRLPVMFWIHGGGNYGGTASSANFDGEKLARHGVVLVSANYRLTIFGFFAHPELTRESPHRASGNYGLMDQIRALQWVRNNIERFGGDPQNVTIFGQSAGAVDANVLMTSPLAKGLFRRVIAESGTVTRNPDAATLGMTALGAVTQVKGGPVTYSDAADLAEAERAGQKVGLGLSLAALRAMPAAELLKLVAGPRMAIGPANGVIVDGWVLAKAPADVFAKGEEMHVPLLIGNHARERTPPQTTSEELTRAALAMYGPLTKRALSLYGFSTPVEPDPLYGAVAAQWVVDTMYRCPVVAQLLWHTAAGNASYEYQFDIAPKGREALGAVHGAEVPYVFGRVGEDEISEAIEQYWTAFAKTGIPTGQNLPQWPAFAEQSRAYLEFTADGPMTGEGLRRPFCDLYLDNVNRLMGR